MKIIAIEINLVLKMTLKMKKNLFNLIKAIHRFLENLLTNNIKMLYTDFDPIKCTKFYSAEELDNFSIEKNPPPFIYNRQYIFPCLLMAYLLVDTYYLIYLNGHYAPYEVVGIMFHYVYPREFWPESDILCHNGNWESILLLLTLIFYPNFDPKYQIYLHENKNTALIQLVSNDKGIFLI